MMSEARFLSALAGAEVDRPPVFFMAGPWSAALSGASRHDLMHDPAALVEAQRLMEELVGPDALLAYYDPLYIPQAYGCQVRFLDSGPIARELPFSRMDEAPPHLGAGRLPVVLEAVERLVARAGGRVPVGTLMEGPLTTLARVVGTEVVLRKTMRDPAALETALGRMVDMLARFGREAVRRGADFLVVADPVASGTMISPVQYRRFALAPQRALAEGVSVPVVLHICGDSLPILGAMAESGAAALSVDQCVDLRQARRASGGKVTLAGNVDPMTLLLGTPEDVARETARVVAAGEGGSFVVMPGCGIPPRAPLENVVAMARTVQERPRGAPGGVAG